MQRVEERRDAIRVAVRRNHAVAISVFGSVARGEERPDSDIDFLVEFEPGASLLDLMTLQEALEAILDCSVDLVSTGGLKARDHHIRREAVPV